MKGDYCQILGVSRNANFTTLRQAFRARVMEHHPDRGGSHEAMVCINEAYAILADRQRRRDTMQRAVQRRPPTFASTPPLTSGTPGSMPLTIRRSGVTSRRG